MQAKTHILLTGAGFTKNFGGPLAAEVWNAILGSPCLDDFPRVRNLLLDDFNFESVYHRVHTQSFSPEEKDAINLAVTGVYSYIDSTIMDLRGSEISVYGVQKMIGGFAGNHYREPGFMFTLNQDLFMERHYYKREAHASRDNTEAAALVHQFFQRPPSAGRLLSIT